MYKCVVKRIIDIFLSAVAIVALIPVWIVIAIAVILDDPGPIFFKQKRIAKNKKNNIQYFQIYKYRTMKMNTPHDVPTHLLNNPEQYITRVGKFLRRTSLDELPQIFNIFTGKMSVIGPRPALWNQEDLYQEREKYAVNDVRPGLTGWAQINGRDELEIPEKAKLDGEYVSKLSFAMDLKCFLGTIKTVLKHEGVVEGGTGAMRDLDPQKRG